MKIYLSVFFTLLVTAALGANAAYEPVVVTAVPNAATQRMLLDRHNDPSFGGKTNQGFAATTLLTKEDVERYRANMASIQSVFGAYQNWNAVVFDPDGTDQENEAVFAVLTDIGYRKEDEDIQANGWTTAKARAFSSCLTGSAPNGGVLTAGANYVEHSLCILWLSQFTEEQDYFEQFPALPEGQFYHRWLIDFGLLDSLYHEYFHHYQKAHTLDRVFGFDNADFNHPEQNAYLPWWWIEGAGQFGSWFARDYWKSIDHLRYLNPDDPTYAGYWESVDWGTPAPNAGEKYNSLDDHITWSIDQLNSTFFFAASQVQNTPNKIGGVLNAGVNDENCGGWMAGPSDGWYQGDPRRGQGFESNCPSIIFAAGTQFIAYKSSWQVALRDIPADYYELGFWGAIEKHLGLTELEFYAEFNALLRSVDASTISKNYAPPGWKIPDADIADVVDFPGIRYYGKKTVAPSNPGMTTFSFDVDESLDAEPLTDGLLVIRHLFGFSGDALISGAVSGDAGRGASGAIAGYLADAGVELDIDGDGESKPLTDGLLLIRYLFGFSGDSLISGAIGSGAERDTAEEVEAYIQDRVPVQ